MTNDTIIRALVSSLASEPPNAREIQDAIRAIKCSSPIALKRARRALANTLSNGGADRLDEDARELCFEVVGSITDDGGRLPTTDGKAAHIHLRVERARKSAYVRAAQACGLSLSEWVTLHCDREAGYQP